MDINHQCICSCFWCLSLKVHIYLGEATIPRAASPLEYWKSNQACFLALACVARKYLSAPSTSVDSEQLFSDVAHVIDEKRNRIACQKAEMLIFVQKNLDTGLIGWTYLLSFSLSDSFIGLLRRVAV